MNMNSARALALVIAGGLAVVGVSELRANGTAPMNAAPKTSIALVNLENLMSKLDETKALNEELRIGFEKRKKDLDELSKKGEALKTERDLLPAESKERRQKAAEMTETQQLLEARTKIFQLLIDMDNGELVRAMYNKILTTIDAFAKKEGYDLVMLDDRGIKLPTQGTQNQVNAAIQAKRVLYANEALDVTSRIATLMNAEYSAPAKK